MVLLSMKRTARRIAIGATAATFGLGAVAVPVMAQTAETPAAPQTMAPAADFSDAKIEAFVTALQEVDDVRLSYLPQLEAADSDTDRAELADAANNEMVERIEAVPDLSVEEYIQIAELAQQDQALSARIVEQVETQAE